MKDSTIRHQIAQGGRAVPDLLRQLPGLLPDWQIREYADAGMITPFEEGIKRPGVISYGLTSAGYDVRLGNNFKMFNPNHCGRVDPKNVDSSAFTDLYYKDGAQVWIPAGGYLLGESVESFCIPREISIICIGKSTYARCGITINVTPGEPEWKGRWTIEIENAAPVPTCVYAGEGIMQCMFHRTVTECEISYKDKGGKYDKAVGLQHAQVDREHTPGTGADSCVAHQAHRLKDKQEGDLISASEIRMAFVQQDGICPSCGPVRYFPTHVGKHPNLRLTLICGKCGAEKE